MFKHPIVNKLRENKSTILKKCIGKAKVFLNQVPTSEEEPTKSEKKPQTLRETPPRRPWTLLLVWKANLIWASEGRAGRKEYGYFWFVFSLVCATAFGIYYLSPFNRGDDSSLLRILFALLIASMGAFILLHALSLIFLAIRRIHDIGISACYLLLLLPQMILTYMVCANSQLTMNITQIIIMGMVLILFVWPGGKPNIYGAGPVLPPTEEELKDKPTFEWYWCNFFLGIVTVPLIMLFLLAVF